MLVSIQMYLALDNRLSYNLYLRFPEVNLAHMFYVHAVSINRFMRF